MDASEQEVRHADEPSSVPEGSVDAGVPGPLRQRGALRAGAYRSTLAVGLRLPGLRRDGVAHDVPSLGPDVLAVRRPPAPVQRG